MELSKYHLDTLEAIVTVAPNILVRKYKEDCCIAATRILIEVLKKLHFRNIKPLVVEANVFNEVYCMKGRPPESEEEAKAWLEEGAWQVVVGDRNTVIPNKWAGHLVVILEDKYMIDLSMFQASRPQKQINMAPICTVVPENFVKGGDKCGLMFNNCMVAYHSYPEDQTYQKAKDWWDKARSADVVSEILSEIKYLLPKKSLPAKPVKAEPPKKKSQPPDPLAPRPDWVPGTEDTYV